MAHRRQIIGMVPLLILALFLVGCPKRPATTTAAPPAPSAPAPAVSAAPAPGTATRPGGAAATRPGLGRPGPAVTPGAPGAPGAAARPPAPKEFAATPELKDIHFDFDKYDIRPGDAMVLDANAKWMKANPNYLILVEGHCDERGTNEYNLALGERRAKATMNYLVAQGVAATRMTLISYGEERPLCAEKTEACWAQNRRAHFLVKPQ